MQLRRGRERTSRRRAAADGLLLQMNWNAARDIRTWEFDWDKEMVQRRVHEEAHMNHELLPI
jgi:hypothetical protein